MKVIADKERIMALVFLNVEALYSNQDSFREFNPYYLDISSVYYVQNHSFIWFNVLRTKIIVIITRV